MPCRKNKVFVCAEQHKIMASAQLRQNSVSRSHLHAGSPAGVAQFCCCDVVCTVRLQQWQRSKAPDDLGACLRARKPLQQFLQYQARRDDTIKTQQSVLQRLNFRF